MRRIIWPLKPYYYAIFKWTMPIPEPEEGGLQLYRKYFRQDDVVIEVGANVGGGTVLLSKLTKLVYAFEPSKINYTMLKINTRKCSNVVCYNVGLGREKSVALLHIHDKNSTSNTASMKKISGVSEYSDSELIRVERLGNMMFEPRPTAMVVDCEGSECEVLQGAQEIIPKLKTIMIETHTLSDGTETIDAIRSELSKYIDAFDVDSSFVEPGTGLKWVVASAKSGQLM